MTAINSENTKQEPSKAYPNIPGFKPSQHTAVGGVVLDDKPIEYNVKPSGDEVDCEEYWRPSYTSRIPFPFLRGEPIFGV